MKDNIILSEAILSTYSNHFRFSEMTMNWGKEYTKYSSPTDYPSTSRVLYVQITLTLADLL